MALDPHSERALAITELFDHHTSQGQAFNRDHSQHGPNPVFKESGWGDDHPCGMSGCPKHNEDYSNRLDDAQFAKVHETRTLNPDQFHQLRPLESVVDLDGPGGVHRAKPPIVAELPGYPGLHVLDGHHRLLRAQKAGQSIDVHVKSG